MTRGLVIRGKERFEDRVFWEEWEEYPPLPPDAPPVGHEIEEDGFFS